MTAPAKAGPGRTLAPARAKAWIGPPNLLGKAHPDTIQRLSVKIEAVNIDAVTELPIAEILARVHAADLLDELLHRLPSDDFAVYRDWLESRGDALGPALSIFIEQLAALRRGNKSTQHRKDPLRG